MLSVEYDYYTEVFKGTLIPDESAFNSASVEAVAYIEYLTHGKVNNLTVVPDSVKNAVCSVCEVIYNANEADTKKTVASESVGEHSVSYAVNKKTQQEQEKEKYRKATLYLARTGFLYGGLS